MREWAASCLWHALGPTATVAFALVVACSGDRESANDAAGVALAPDDAAGEDSPSDASPVSTDASSKSDAATTDASTKSDALTIEASSKSDAFDASACISSENDAGTCNDVQPGGPMVTAGCSSAEPPQPQGGAIENGMYELMAFTQYGACPTAPDIGATTWMICGDHWDVAQLTLTPAGGGAPIQHINFVAAALGTSITYTSACGPLNFNGIPPRGYSASPGHLTFIYPSQILGSNTISVSEYAKR